MPKIWEVVLGTKVLQGWSITEEMVPCDRVDGGPGTWTPSVA